MVDVRYSPSMEDQVVWNKDSRFALLLNKFIVWPLGLWPYDCDSVFSWFRFVLAFISQLYILGTQVSAFYKKCGSPSDAVDYIMLIVCVIMALSKIVTFRIHMDKIRTVISCAIEDWIFINDKTRQTIIPFSTTGRFAFKVQIGFCYLSNTLIVMGTLPFLMPPMTNQTVTDDTSWFEKNHNYATEFIGRLVTAKNNESKNILMRELPLKTGCLLAQFKDGIYWFFYFFESFSITITAHGNVGCDIFIFVLLMHLCGQMELLKTDFQQIGTDPTEVYNESRRKVVKVIRRHVKLLDLAESLNKTVSGMLVVQLLLNAGINLMLGIRILMALKDNMYFDAARPMIAFNVLMLQLYILSYASDCLSQQSETILDSLYDSNWYELPRNLQKDLYYVALRTCKPIYLIAGNFYVLNIENFKNVLKASFSYFSILRIMFDG